MRLSGKTALITGAASGIGAACATLFKAEGARVAGVDRNAEGLSAAGDVLEFSRPPDPYTHSKGAVLQMTRDLAVSGAPDRIRVNALCPGFIVTPLTIGLRENNAIKDALVSMHPLGRLGEPEEVARCALFLASDEASYVTGTSLAVDGGYLAI